MLHLHRGNDLSENATEWNKKTNENVVQSTSVNATEAVDYDTIRWRRSRFATNTTRDGRHEQINMVQHTSRSS
jgi:hypothetical protein